MSFSMKAEDFDLELTMTCGQTFCWNRVNGELYGEGEPRFYTFRKGAPVLVEDRGDRLFVETELSQSEVEKALGIDHDLDPVFREFPDDRPVEKSRKEYWGLRVVQDEFFPCLISYLCSPQMRIPRIKEMHNKIAEKFGEKIEYKGVEMRRFPTPEELSKATEEELRELGIGYRAEYIIESTKQVLEDFDPEEVKNLDYEEARKEMKKLHGVGDKVADCVLLFSLGFHEAAPLDTWAKKSLKRHYPELHSEKYEKASRNMREYFGEKAGYAQEYIFHAARNGVIEVEE